MTFIIFPYCSVQVPFVVLFIPFFQNISTFEYHYVHLLRFIITQMVNLGLYIRLWPPLVLNIRYYKIKLLHSKFLSIQIIDFNRFIRYYSPISTLSLVFINQFQFSNLKPK